MFQTNLNHFFQSFDSAFFTGLMQAVSLFGTQYVIIPLLIILMFGFHFRKGFILIQVVGWSSVFIVLFKELFSLPRPYDVDASLHPFGADYTLPADRFLSRGGERFFSGLPAEMVETLRQGGLSDFGFPSGHVTLSTSFFGSLMILFRQTWVWVLSIFFILAMPVSRMFLARHFLADTLGGLFLGGLVIVLAWFIILRTPAFVAFMNLKFLRLFRDGIRWSWFLLLIVLPLGIMALPGAPLEPVAQLFGFNLGFLLVIRKGIPVQSGRFLPALGRVSLVLVMMFGLVFLFHEVSSLIPFLESPWGKGIKGFLQMIIPIWAGTGLCLKLGWYTRN